MIAPSRHRWRPRFRHLALAGIGALCLAGIWPTLPCRFSPDAFPLEDGFQDAPAVLAEGPGGAKLVTVLRVGPLAFSSFHRYVAVYGSSGWLRDEVQLGEFSVRFVRWDDAGILLETRPPRDAADAFHIRSWTDRHTSIAGYRLRFSIPPVLPPAALSP